MEPFRHTYCQVQAYVQNFIQSLSARSVAPSVSQDIVIDGSVTPEQLTQQIKDLIVNAGADYDDGSSWVANFIKFGNTIWRLNLRIHSITLNNLTLCLESKTEMSPNMAEFFDQYGSRMYVPSWMKFIHCTFTDNIAFEFEYGEGNDITLKSNAQVIMGHGGIIRLDGEKTEANIVHGTTAHINVPGAKAIGWRDSTICLHTKEGMDIENDDSCFVFRTNRN